MPAFLRAVCLPEAQGSSLWGAAPAWPDAPWAPRVRSCPRLVQASHELREMSLGISEQCNVSFVSFWDLGPRIEPSDDPTEAAVLALADRALALAAEGRLFNADATATLLVASVRACGGTPVTLRCASEANGFCAPIAQLSQRLKDYAARANGLATGLRLQVLPRLCTTPSSPCPLGGVAHAPATVPSPAGLALQRLGYVTHSGRALAPPTLQREAAARALAPEPTPTLMVAGRATR